jgi:glycosyltransferase involved in cell wall biosynthesis
MNTLKKNIVIVTNMPTPYRTPIYELVSKNKNFNLNLIYCTKRESNRKWVVDKASFSEFFLKSNYATKKDGFNFVHNNYDVFYYLKKIKPDLIITCGYNPTHLYAFAYSLFKHIPHVSMTDCWDHSEKSLSILHRLVRKMVFKYTSKWVIPGSKGLKHLTSNYGISDKDIIQIPLCADTERNLLKKKCLSERDIDFIYVGNLEIRKNPVLFIESCNSLQQKTASKINFTIVGEGPLNALCNELSQKYKLNMTFTGNVPPDEVIEYLARSKFMVFPTALDAWGLVVNEALSCGTPVISSVYAASTHDLIIQENNGFLISELSIPVISELMSKAYNLNDDSWEKMAEKALRKSSFYSYQAAADKLIAEVLI